MIKIVLYIFLAFIFYAMGYITCCMFASNSNSDLFSDLYAENLKLKAELKSLKKGEETSND